MAAALEQCARRIDHPSAAGRRLLLTRGRRLHRRSQAIWDGARSRGREAEHTIDLTGGTMRLRALIVTLLAMAGLVLAAAGGAAAISGKQPLAIVLCKFTDLTTEPQTAVYYEKLFNEKGAGQKGAFDYWRDVSYGKLDLTGTVVKGWYDVGMTVADFYKKGRQERVSICASKAVGVDFSKFAGVAAITNQTLGGGDVFGAGPPQVVGGTLYQLGIMQANSDTVQTVLLHESGHSLGFEHSRTVTQQVDQDDYGDPFDVMSCDGCRGTPALQGRGGPGLNAVQLDRNGWIDASREIRDFTNASCNQRTFQMAAINHPEAPGYLEARIPASVFIQKIGTSTTTDHYAIELRDKSGWDAGIGPNVVLIHMHGQDDYSYWVDPASTLGTYYRTSFQTDGLVTGDEYVDTARKAFVAVQAMDDAAHTATVTIAGCKINVSAALSGATTGDFSDSVTLGADFTVTGSSAPVPFRNVTLTLGTQSCTAATNAAGHASCNIVIDQHPGPVTAGASFSGDNAYAAAEASKSFTINKETSKLTYSGPVTADYHDAFTASAVLGDPDSGAGIAGKTIVFTLGASDTCSAVTNAAGVASCSITANQDAGPYSIVASFGPDTDYVSSSDTKAFTITKEATALSYSGAATSDYHDAFTASASLLEEDGGGPVPGKTIVFTLGVGDTCSAPTNAAGLASCSITPTQAAGPYSIVATFQTDTNYLASSDTKPFTITKEETTLSYDGPFKVANDFPATLTGTLLEDGVTPIAGRSVMFTVGSGIFAQTCTGTTDAAGKAACTIPSVKQPASATSVSVGAAFAGDPFYLPASASATAKLLYYTGRAYNATLSIPLVPTINPNDTGSIQTASKSDTQRSTARASGLLLSGSVLTARVVTGLGSSTATTSAATVSVGAPGLAVTARGINSSSTSTCSAASGTTTIDYLAVAGVVLISSRTTIGPNSGLSVGPIKVLLNEQKPVAGADKGLLVNAIRISTGLTELVVGSARSDIHNC
jgi:hypothetical protein